ncbi:nucleolar protein 16 [Periplaneta americana]|uniref:nucleolar protein 16 n=1 Tax=Periplaneta americana TaxID=6978 RepID=UPI0037E92BAF
MTKVRKQKRQKKYRYHVNRKKLSSRRRKLPNIGCSQVKNAWELNKTAQQNLKDMGLVYDVNKSLKIPSAKELLKPVLEVTDVSEKQPKRLPRKEHVAKELEIDAKAPRVKKFRLPNNQVQWLTYLMDKYDEDYKAMERDPKNYYQETWRQIRHKINRFKSIPEQYNKYLESRNKCDV